MSNDQEKLETKIDKPEAAAAHAQQAYDEAESGLNKKRCFTLLMAKKKALQQLCLLHAAATAGVTGPVFKSTKPLYLLSLITVLCRLHANPMHNCFVNPPCSQVSVRMHVACALSEFMCTPNLGATLQKLQADLAQPSAFCVRDCSTCTQLHLCN